MVADEDKVFKALADTSRRELLDRLRRRNGQTLGELCEGHGMSRQAVTKHLVLLEAANLVATTKRGREKLHYLNPVPINAIYTRWIGKFERKRVQALHNLKHALRGTIMTSQDFVYTTYIKSTPEKVWAAITNPEFTRQYMGKDNISDWKKGSDWKHADTKGDNVRIIGKVLESNPPKRLVLTWADPTDTADDSRVTYEIDAVENMVRLTVVHGHFKPGSVMAPKVAMGWPLVLSSMKSLLETGKAIDVMVIKAALGQGCGSEDAAA